MQNVLSEMMKLRCAIASMQHCIHCRGIVFCYRLNCIQTSRDSTMTRIPVTAIMQGHIGLGVGTRQAVSGDA